MAYAPGFAFVYVFGPGNDILLGAQFWDASVFHTGSPYRARTEAHERPTPDGVLQGIHKIKQQQQVAKRVWR
jgi:hypothetical protein